MSKQFSDVAKISRETARQHRVKMNFKVTTFLTEFNHLLPDLNEFVRNRLPLLLSDPKMKIPFSGKSIKAIYKRGKNLKEIFQSATVTKDALYALISWFLIIPLNVQQQVSTIKLKKLYFVIVSMWSA